VGGDIRVFIALASDVAKALVPEVVEASVSRFQRAIEDDDEDDSTLPVRSGDAKLML
jgi:hypothetical protein